MEIHTTFYTFKINQESASRMCLIIIPKSDKNTYKILLSQSEWDFLHTEMGKIISKFSKNKDSKLILSACDALLMPVLNRLEAKKSSNLVLLAQQEYFFGKVILHQANENSTDEKTSGVFLHPETRKRRIAKIQEADSGASINPHTVPDNQLLGVRTESGSQFYDFLQSDDDKDETSAVGSGGVFISSASTVSLPPAASESETAKKPSKRKRAEPERVSEDSADEAEHSTQEDSADEMEHPSSADEAGSSTTEESADEARLSAHQDSSDDEESFAKKKPVKKKQATPFWEKAQDNSVKHQQPSPAYVRKSTMHPS